jgi:ATP-dependent protease HslVU (ClpYQ) peptidase subunit
MTCIVAFRDEKENIIIAGDKMGSDSYSKMIVKEPKVFINGDFAIGYTDSFRMGQLLKHVWVPPERKMEQETDNYLYADVTKSLRGLFKDNGFGDDDNNEFGAFIMVYEDRILEMQGEMSLLEHETDIVSVGAGCYHATAALQVLLEYDSEVEEVLDKTFEVVAYNIVSVSQEYDLITVPSHKIQFRKMVKELAEMEEQAEEEEKLEKELDKLPIDDTIKEKKKRGRPKKQK